MSVKLKRIESEMIKEISSILSEEARNEYLKKVSITDISVDPDLTLAKVYFMTRDEDATVIENELNKSAGFIKALLAKRLNLRNTPDLRFVQDKSVEYRREIESKIEEINEEVNDRTN